MYKDRVAFFVTFDPNLVSESFMAEHLYELEGVEVVTIEDAD